MRRSRHALLCCFALAAVRLQAQGAAYLDLAADPDHVVRLRHGDPWPERLAGVTEITGLVDRALLREGFHPRVDPTLEVGAYRAGRHLVFIRSGDGALAHMASCLGLPVAELDDPHQLAAEARAGRSYSRYSLLVHAWRLGDRFPWPWVAQGRAFGGLSALIRKVNPTKHGFRYDADRRCYLDAKGEPLAITGIDNDDLAAVKPGTVVSAAESHDPAVLAVLWRDRGRTGLLDPDDLVLTAQRPGGAPADRVHATKLGLLVRRDPIHCSNRDIARARDLVGRRVRPDNPAWGLSTRQQWLLFAGMLVIVITLLRWMRVQRRRNRRRERELEERYRRLPGTADGSGGDEGPGIPPGPGAEAGRG